MLAETVEMHKPSSRKKKKIDPIEKALALETIQLDAGDSVKPAEPPGASTSDVLEAIPISVVTPAVKDRTAWPTLLLVDADAALAEEVKAYCDAKELQFEWLTSASELDTYQPSVPPQLVIFKQHLDGTDLRYKVKPLRDRSVFGNAVMLVLTDGNLDELEIRKNRKMGFPIALKKPIALAALDRHVVRPGRMPETECVTSSELSDFKSRMLQRSHLPVRTRRRLVLPKKPGGRTHLNPRRPLNQSGPWDRAIGFGSACGIFFVLAFAFLPGGYTQSFARWEGPVMGLFMGLIVALQLRQLNPRPTLQTFALTLMPLTLIPNALILLARWIFGYEIVTRHVSAALKTAEIPERFVLLAAPGDEPPPTVMNADDYSGLLSIALGFLLAWSVATLVGLPWVMTQEPRRDRLRG